MWIPTNCSGCGPLVSCNPPTPEVTTRAVNQLKSGNAPGGSGIYAGMLKVEGQAVLLYSHTLLCSICNLGIISTHLRRGVVVPI